MVTLLLSIGVTAVTAVTPVLSNGVIVSTGVTTVNVVGNSSTKQWIYHSLLVGCCYNIANIMWYCMTCNKDLFRKYTSLWAQEKIPHSLPSWLSYGTPSVRNSVKTNFSQLTDSIWWKSQTWPHFSQWQRRHCRDLCTFHSTRSVSFWTRAKSNLN